MRCENIVLALDSPYGLLLHCAIVWQNVKMAGNVNYIAQAQPMHVENFFG